MIKIELKLKLVARWKRFCHCLLKFHRMETYTERGPGLRFVTTSVRCYECEKEFLPHDTDRVDPIKRENMTEIIDRLKLPLTPKL